MGSRRRNEETPRRDGNVDKEGLTPVRSSALEENVQAIKRWERAILLARSKAEQVSDWIACTAGSGPVLVLHVVWFGIWVTVNAGAIRGIRPFDPFPFPFLTMTVSLEAIFLALFVLASQNRLTRQADKRSHLDLQVDLLAEREMTAVLQLLQDIARALGCSDQRDAGAVARPDEEDRPSTANESVGGVGGARHLDRFNEFQG